METLQLQAKVRDVATAAQGAAKLRQHGSMPAVLYGHNVANVHLALDQGEFAKVLRKAGESTVIQVMVDDKPHNVLIQDVQRHYLTSEPIHADFYEVSMTEKLTATVQLEFEGESDAVKLLGGTLVKVLSEVEVECLPADLPHNLTVDISKLKTFDDIFEVKDIVVSPKVEVKTTGEEVVAMVQPPRDVEAELAEPVGEIDVTAVEGVADAPADGDAGAAEEDK